MKKVVAMMLVVALMAVVGAGSASAAGPFSNMSTPEIAALGLGGLALAVGLYGALKSPPPQPTTPQVIIIQPGTSGSGQTIIIPPFRTSLSGPTVLEELNRTWPANKPIPVVREYQQHWPGYPVILSPYGTIIVDR